MALRVGGARPMPPVTEEEELPMEDMPLEDMEMPEEEMLEEEMPEEMPAEEAPMEPTDLRGLVDPTAAGYKGPEMGPFKCGNCQYYAGQGACVLLAQDVDEEAVCNLFVGAEEDSEEPMEEEMPQEMPEEAPPVEEMPEEIAE